MCFYDILNEKKKLENCTSFSKTKHDLFQIYPTVYGARGSASGAPARLNKKL